MKTSKVTGKTYDPAQAVYITNPKQHFAYARYFSGWDYFLDMHFTPDKIDGACAFVWLRCPETREAKIKWDNHELE
jgi:hypothetical protein